MASSGRRLCAGAALSVSSSPPGTASRPTSGGSSGTADHTAGCVHVRRSYEPRSEVAVGLLLDLLNI